MYTVSLGKGSQEIKRYSFLDIIPKCILWDGWGMGEGWVGGWIPKNDK